MNTKVMDKARTLVENEVLTCQTSLIEDKFPYWFEQAENLIMTDEELLGWGYADPQQARKNGEDMKEVYEWWLVTDWFANRLREHNEVILNTDYGIYWGRTCTGQAIYLDYVIEQIVKDTIY